MSHGGIEYHDQGLLYYCRDPCTQFLLVTSQQDTNLEALAETCYAVWGTIAVAAATAAAAANAVEVAGSASGPKKHRPGPWFLGLKPRFPNPKPCILNPKP